MLVFHRGVVGKLFWRDKFGTKSFLVNRFIGWKGCLQDIYVFLGFLDPALAPLLWLSTTLCCAFETRRNQHFVSSKRCVQINHRSRYEWHNFAKNRQSTEKSDVYKSLLAQKYPNVSQQPPQKCWSYLLMLKSAYLSHCDCCWRTQKYALNESCL